MAEYHCSDPIWTWRGWTIARWGLHCLWVTVLFIDGPLVQKLLPQNFSGDGLLECVKELIRLDKHWIPTEPGHSLYVRPTISKPVVRMTWALFKCSFPIVGNQEAIGVSPPTEAMIFVICCPVGPYYPQGFKPIALYGTTEYIRAAPGGSNDSQCELADLKAHTWLN